MNEFSFDVRYDPALPACKATISVALTGRCLDMPAIIDTGADATLIPLEYLQELGARRYFEAGLRSQWGERRVVFLYLIDIQIGQITMPGVYAVGDDLGDEVILGRDVLNRLRVLLDGPAEKAQFLEEGERIRRRRRI
jgi:predicted aspartyl protease